MNILFAASPSIGSFAISQSLDSLGAKSPEHKYFFINGNTSLRNELISRWPDTKEIQAKSKSDFRKILKEISHLVLIWDGEELTDLLFEARFERIPTKLFACKVTKIVNKNLTSNYDVYIGRGTLWGNPFAISREEDGPDRAEVIAKYKEYFDHKVSTDSAFRKGLLGLRGLRLACHCKPEACHGDVIAAYLDGPESIKDDHILGNDENNLSSKV